MVSNAVILSYAIFYEIAMSIFIKTLVKLFQNYTTSERYPYCYWFIIIFYIISQNTICKKKNAIYEAV